MSLSTEKVLRATSAWEWLLAPVLLLIPAALLVFHGGTYFSWGDEVQFVDPAASALFGQGFTSMAWPYQASTELFAGNAPGYSLLLVPWFALVGFGLDQARWLNLPLAAGGGALLWLGLGRVVPNLPLWLKALAVSTSFLGVGILISSGSARYDMLDLLVSAWMFWLLTATPRPAHPGWLVLAGAALFYAGFHLVAGAAIVMLLLVLQDRTRFFRPAVALVAGIAVGLASWLLVLATQGLFAKFFVMLFGSQHTISGQMAKLVLQGDRGVLDKTRAFGSLATLDPSLSVIVLFLLAMLATQWRRLAKTQIAGRSSSTDRLIGWLAIDFALILPVGLLILGKFPVYYSWMAYVPSVLMGAVWAWRCLERGIRWPLAVFVASALGAAALGVRDRVVHRDIEPGSGDYAHFQGWVRGSLLPTDLVYADHEAYFAARRVAMRVIAPTYAQTALVRGIPEQASVSALLIQEAHRAKVMTLIGGNWREAARYRSVPGAGAAPKLDFVLLRRAGTS